MSQRLWSTGVSIPGPRSLLLFVVTHKRAGFARKYQLLISTGEYHRSLPILPGPEAMAEVFSWRETADSLFWGDAEVMSRWAKNRLVRNMNMKLQSEPLKACRQDRLGLLEKVEPGQRAEVETWG